MKAIHGDEENADLEHFLSDLILDQVTPSAMTRTAYICHIWPYICIWMRWDNLQLNATISYVRYILYYIINILQDQHQISVIILYNIMNLEKNNIHVYFSAIPMSSLTNNIDSSGISDGPFSLESLLFRVTSISEISGLSRRLMSAHFPIPT
jgi:hypothetical protein